MKLQKCHISYHIEQKQSNMGIFQLVIQQM